MKSVIIYILLFSVIPLIFALGSRRKGKQEDEYMKNKNVAKPENTSAPDTRGKTEPDNNEKSPRRVANPQPGIAGSQPERKIARDPWPYYNVPPMMWPAGEEYRTGGDEDEELRW